jgi:hypothetical protein
MAKRFLGNIHWRSIVRGKEKDSEPFGRDWVLEGGCFKKRSNPEAVPQGLRHLRVVDRDKSIVDPGCDKCFSGCGLALGPLIFMMGKKEIEPTPMNIERIPELMETHRRAFDMPSRPSGTKRSLIIGFPFLHPLPEGEIKRILLVFIRLNPGS